MNTNMHDNNSYKGARIDLLAYVNKKCKNILDFGCNEGASGQYVKKYISHEIIVDGIDYNPKAISKATQFLDRAKVVDCDNILKLQTFLKTTTYDHIIIGDVLEHLKYPVEVMNLLIKHLSEEGTIIISIPNSSFYLSLIYIFKRRWPRNPRGVYDKTHLRLYMLHNLIELAPVNSEFKLLKRKIRAFDKGTKLDKPLKYTLGAIPYLRDFFTYQYIFKVTKR